MDCAPWQLNVAAHKSSPLLVQAGADYFAFEIEKSTTSGKWSEPTSGPTMRRWITICGE